MEKTYTLKELIELYTKHPKKFMYTASLLNLLLDEELIEIQGRIELSKQLRKEYEENNQDS